MHAISLKGERYVLIDGVISKLQCQHNIQMAESAVSGRH